MKKFLLAIFFLIASFGMVNAQTKKPKETPKKEVVSKAKENDKKVKHEGDHLKKDGTPDKRFKENKGAKKAAGPLKKDGTPDMRYKANKKG